MTYAARFFRAGKGVFSGSLPGWVYVGAIVVLWWLAGSALLQSFGVRRDPDYSAQMRKDPKLGASIPLSLSGHSGPTYLLAVRTCSCNASFLNPVLTELPSSVRLVVVVSATKTIPDSVRGLLRKGDAVLPDPDYQISNGVNACFMPRGYLFDASSKLAWLQTDDKLSTASAAREAMGHFPQGIASKEVK